MSFHEHQRSRDVALGRFLCQLTESSSDGSVHTCGKTLCVGRSRVAFWFGGIIYLVPLRDGATSLAKDVQAAIRQGDHGHTVVRTEINDAG